jgi:hypothetical protein
LHERLAALGGTVDAGGCPAGWRLRAELGAACTCDPISVDTASARP